MPYLTVADLKMKVDERTLIELTDTTASNSVDTAAVERAIRDASAIADSFAGKHFSVPFNPVPHAVADAVAALAIRSLHRFRNLASPAWEQAGEEAMVFLSRLADGSIVLDGAVQKPSPSDSVSSTVTLSGPGRVFSRDLLKGM
jgi:phage gp36-like protein